MQKKILFLGNFFYFFKEKNWFFLGVFWIFFASVRLRLPGPPAVPGLLFVSSCEDIELTFKAAEKLHNTTVKTFANGVVQV